MPHDDAPATFVYGLSQVLGERLNSRPPAPPSLAIPRHRRGGRGGRAHGVSGARQRSGGVEKYNSIASRQAPEHGSTAISPGPDSRISAAVFSAQLMQTPARSIPQPVQLQLDL
jgi:hypothetical protein